MKHYFLILILFAWGCKPYLGGVKKVKSQYVTNEKQDQSRLDDIIAPYKAELDAEMNEVLNTSNEVLNKDIPQGLLGNFVADLVLERGKTFAKNNNLSCDVAVLNNGGLRTSIPKGEVTRRRIFELMPFENELVILKLKPNTYQELLQYMADQAGIPMAGETISLHDSTFTATTYDNAPYIYVITSDYLAKGGDRMSFFADAVATYSVKVKLRDAIIDHIVALKKTGHTITSSIDKRTTHAK